MSLVSLTQNAAGGAHGLVGMLAALLGGGQTQAAPSPYVAGVLPPGALEPDTIPGAGPAPQSAPQSAAPVDPTSLQAAGGAAAALPPLPTYAPRGHLGDVLDNLFTGGAFQRASQNEYNEQVSNFNQARQQAFLDSLSPAEKKAYIASPDAFGKAEATQFENYNLAHGDSRFGPAGNKIATAPNPIADSTNGIYGFANGDGTINATSVPTVQKVTSKETAGPIAAIPLAPGAGIPPTPPAAPAATPGAPAAPSLADIAADPGKFFSGLAGAPVTVTSAARTAAHNAAVGGSPTSEHLTGSAWDMVPPKGMTNAELITKLRASGTPFDQIINEGDHVHFGIGPKMRGQILASNPQGGYTQIGATAPPAPPAGPTAGPSPTPAGLPATMTGPKVAPPVMRNGRLEQTEGDGTVTTVGSPLFDIDSNRKEFNGSPDVVQYQNALGPYMGLTNALKGLKGNNGALDQASVDAFLQNINPKVSPRQNTVKMVLEHFGFPQEAEGAIDNALGQGFVTPQSMNDMLKVMSGYLQAHHDLAVRRMNEVQGTAAKYNVAPDMLGVSVDDMPPAPKIAFTGDNARNQPPAGAPAGTRQAPDGNFYAPDPARPGKWLRIDPGP